ncbi:MBL fold metallo-hydrolase [Bacteroidota bacterium]
MRTLCITVILLILNAYNLLFCEVNSEITQKFFNTEMNSDLAIVTYVGNNIQERATRAFIKSVRDLAGSYKNCPIYIVLTDEENFPCESLKGENVILLPQEMGKEFNDYPLAVKSYVAAQVEKITAAKVRTLAWFDPATLLLDSPNELDLNNNYSVAVRPVSLVNTIGITPGSEPNDYWAPIYEEFNLDYNDLPAYKTVVDEQPIQPYFNCEIFSVNPSLGIFTEWAKLLTNFLNDEEYQKNVCNTPLRRLFLHQAVLSGIIMKKVSPEKIKSLSIKSGYPFNQHDQLAEEKKIKSLNELSAVIFDYTWDRNARWADKIPIEEPLKDWLTETYADYLRLGGNLYRSESQCNSYLVTTNDGSVLIDPAGAGDVPEYFQKIIEKHPVKAILLTHAHRDHWNNMDVWRTDPSIPIIANRNFPKYNEYWGRLSQFFARRGAIWGGRPIPDKSEIEPLNPVVPTITFADEYTYEQGGFTFKMVHTPGETPDHTTIYIPELEAVFVGDNYYQWFINNATLRGTLTRPVLGYINALDLALSYEPEYFLPGHSSPVVSKNVIKETVTNFRDAIQYLHDETIKGINEGKEVYTLMREIKLPEKYQIGEYFGKAEWTIRGIYHENIGWFDENPSSMYAIPASSVYKDLVELAGGADAVAKFAQKYIDEKEYVKVLHITDAALEAEPENKSVLEIRLTALKALLNGPYNYIERIWLNHGIKSIEEIIRH